MLRMQTCSGFSRRADRSLCCLVVLALLASLGAGLAYAQRPSEEVHIDLGVIGLSTMATLFPSMVHRPIETIPARPGGDAAGMGGAYLAVADGVKAVGWSPAGLASLERSEILFDGRVRNAGGSASGYPDSVLVPQQPPLLVTQYSMNNKDAMHTGFVGAAAPLFRAGSINVVGALSWRRFGEIARPEEVISDLGFGEERSFPVVFTVDARERGVIESFAPSIAVQLVPGVTFGANLNFLSGRLRSTYEERLSSGGFPLIGTGEITFRYSGFVPDLGAGISLIGGRARMAAKFTPSYTLNVSGGRFHTRSINAPNQPVYHVSGKVSGYELEVPSALGVGVAIRPFRRLLLAADYNVQNWSEASLAYTEDLTGNPLAVGNMPGKNSGYEETTTLPLDDVSSVHVGMEYLLFEWDWAHIPVRFGFHKGPLGFRSSDRDDVTLVQLELPNGAPYQQPVHTGVFHGESVEADAVSYGVSLRTGSFTYDLGVEHFSYEENKWFFDTVYDPVMNPGSRLVKHTKRFTSIRLSSTVHF